MNFIAVEDYNPATVSITSVRPQGMTGVLPVNIAAGSASITIGQVIPSVSSTVSSGPALLISKRIATADTNQVLVKAGPGRCVGGHLYNASAAVKFFKLFNKVTAPVTGTDTPVITIPVAPSTGVNLAEVFSDFGLNFATGIGFAITGALADLDNTPVAAGDMNVNLIYI